MLYSRLKCWRCYSHTQSHWHVSYVTLCVLYRMKRWHGWVGGNGACHSQTTDALGFWALQIDNKHNFNGFLFLPRITYYTTKASREKYKTTRQLMHAIIENKSHATSRMRQNRFITLQNSFSLIIRITCTQP